MDNEEIEENFMKECEEAIQDRDEKIKALISELSQQKTSITHNNHLEKIDHSIIDLKKKFLKLQKFFENFEEKKLKKSENSNIFLRRENENLKANFSVFQEKSKKTSNFIVKNLKNGLLGLKDQLIEIKGKQRENSDKFGVFIQKNKEKCLSGESTKLFSTIESDYNKSMGNKSFLTPNTVKTKDSPSEKRVSEGVQCEFEEKKGSFSENSSQTNNKNKKMNNLKDKRKSFIIQCILNSMNKKDLLKKFEFSKVFSVFFWIKNSILARKK